MRRLLKAIREVYAYAITKEHLAQIDAELAKPDEPVAWMYKYKKGGSFIRNSESKHKHPAIEDVGIPLYTHLPRQQEPLSDDEIWDLWKSPGKGCVDFARAIERAHGIVDK